jgi:hypothetical protein
MIESLQNAIIDHIDELGNNFDWSYYAIILGTGQRDSPLYKLSLTQLSRRIRAAGGWVKFKEAKEPACFNVALFGVEHMEFVCEALSLPTSAKSKKTKCAEYHKHIDTKKC